MFVWAVLLIVVMGASLAIASVALPRMFLRTKYTVDKSLDRGIKHISISLIAFGVCFYVKK